MLFVNSSLRRFFRGIFRKKSKFRLFTAHTFSKIITITVGLIIAIFFFFFLLKPVFIIIKRAFIVDSGFTLDYIQLLCNNQQFFSYLLNSLKLGLITTFFTTMLALPLAIINTRFIYFGRQVMASLIMLSMFAPPFVSSIGIKYLFSHYGIINTFFIDMGLIQSPIPFLGGHSLIPIVLIQVLHLYPIMYLSLSSTLLNIDPSIEEASITLGIGRLKRYKDIIWPLVRPGFFAGAIVVFIWSFTDLGTPLMTHFNEVLSVGIFHQMNEMIDNPYGYVLVFFMMCMTTFCILLVKSVLAVDHRHKMQGKTYGKRSLAKPSKWQAIGIYTALISLIAISFIPHAGVLITSIASSWCNTYLPSAYTLSAYRNLLSSDCVLGIKNSLFYGCIATLINLSIGSFIAYIIAKKKVFLWTNMIDALVMMPLFLPGIVLSFGYMITYMDTWLDPGKNPTVLLIMAYSVRYIPYTVRGCVASLQQVNNDLEEAASVFGASSLRTFWQITVPVILPSLIASGLLAFSRTILEVSESLLLATKEAYYPITKVLYNLYSSHGDGPAKASALGVATLLIISLVVITVHKLLGKKAGSIFRINS